jgi:hypothetical protein
MFGNEEGCERLQEPDMKNIVHPPVSRFIMSNAHISYLLATNQTNQQHQTTPDNTRPAYLLLQF